MLDALIAGFETDAFCAFLRSKFPSFSESRRTVRLDSEFPWASAQQIGVVKTIAGPNGMNMPLLVVVASLPEGESLRERSSRVRQFNFARKVVFQALAAPAPGITGSFTQGLFVFHDADGNFRLSLVYGKPEGTKPVWSTAKRLSFYVGKDAGNKTFRDRARLDWTAFDKLKDAFSVEKLTKEFYGKLFDWYQGALSDEMNVTYPNNTDTDADERQINEHIIRLITRLMFVWFLKQKHLVPGNLFDPAELKTILKSFDPLKGDNYYRAILQNLFFATLNSQIGERAFAVDAGNITENIEHFDIKTLYRYGGEFAIPQDAVLKLFEKIPFLNGGLFECLDRGKLYSDGFSRNSRRQARLPNRLFFDPVKGLLPLLKQYNFTVEENSPDDEEVALDPELLGKVFENLLGAYNPETKVAARNATGSFYTPREIVNYMVDESLIAHILQNVAQASLPVTTPSPEDAVRRLFTDGTRPDDDTLCLQIDNALVTAKILDPACGSGAFPMGILLRMVELLRILRRIGDDDHAAIYDLKLQLIENCIYGGDIQSIAVQISKLRFFISLVCEQKPTTNAAKNYGINPLPNLETKFVAADSLIALAKPKQRTSDGLAQADMFSEEEDPEIKKLKKDLWDVRHKHFLARSYRQKKSLRSDDKKLRQLLANTLKQKQGFTSDSAEKMAAWDPYDQNTSATWSDPEWMFNVKDGFDIVIGNPPYGVALNTSVVKNLDQRFEECKSRTRNSAIYFVYIADVLLKSTGVNSFVVPKSLCYSAGWRPCAQFLMPHLSKIIDLGKAFENVLLEQVAYVYVKSKTPDHFVNGILEPSFVKEVAHVNKRMFYRYKVILAGHTDAELKLLMRINECCPDVYKDYVTISRGLNWQANSKEIKHIGATPIYRGAQLDKWLLNPAIEHIDLNSFSKTEYEYQLRPKILNQLAIAHVQNPYPHFFIQSALDYSGSKLVFETISCTFVRGDHFDVKFLLGFNNSLLFAWLLYKLIYSNAIRSTRFDEEYVGRIPIPDVPKEKQEYGANIVDRILVAKKADPSADTSVWVAEIDRLVYELYGLTEEEIAIVDGSSGGKAESRKLKAEIEAGEPEDDDAVGRPASGVPKKKPAPRKLKANLPPSLPGWD